MSDYKGKIARLLECLHDWQSEEGTTDASMLTVVLEAQVLATQQLVEQQRIANMIEVGRDRDRQLARELNDPNYHVLDGSTLKVSAPTDLLNASNAVKALIREGLGI